MSHDFRCVSVDCVSDLLLRDSTHSAVYPDLQLHCHGLHPWSPHTESREICRQNHILQVDILMILCTLRPVSYSFFSVSSFQRNRTAAVQLYLLLSFYGHFVFWVVAGVVLFFFTLDFIRQYVQGLSSLFRSMLYV